MPLLRAATEADAEQIRGLLGREGLPTSDLAAARPDFVVAVEDGELIGIGGLQPFGDSALVRSIAVSAQRRRRGLGRDIVLELERRAREAKITELILLTQTAVAFFEHLGYRAIERSRASPAVQVSEEFRSLCPASAVCMLKLLTECAP